MPALPSGRYAAPWAAAVTAAALLAGCRAHVAAPAKGEVVEGSTAELPPRPVYSDPKPPSAKEPPPPQAAAAAPPSAAPKKQPPPAKKAPPPARQRQDLDEDAAGDADFVLRRSSTAAALFGAARPDPGDQKGTPLARRPDQGSVAPPGPPLRYLSPAPLHALRTARRSPGAGAEAPPELDAEPSAAGSARRPDRAPATGLMLDDSIPDTGIADPDEIGSYHVQIASSPDFSTVLFDKVYPFMGEVDLEKDLKGAPRSLRTVWIRWSLVDLLDYEHPFARPKRLRLSSLARGGQP